MDSAIEKRCCSSFTNESESSVDGKENLMDIQKASNGADSSSIKSATSQINKSDGHDFHDTRSVDDDMDYLLMADGGMENPNMLSPMKSLDGICSNNPFSSPNLHRRAVQAEKMMTDAGHYISNVCLDAWNVCHFNALPKWLQDNEFLYKGHRPQLPSFKACFWSIFRLHTETMNIWTHMIGFFLFTFLFIYNLVLSPHTLKWSDHIVLGVFFLTAMICLGLSSTYHTFSCHSPHVGKFFSKLDYCGIALLITGSIIPWVYYGFYCDYVSKTFYLTLVMGLGMLCTYVTLSETFGEPGYRGLRAGTFVTFGLSGVIPGIHWLTSQEWFTTDALRASFNCLIVMGVLYITGAIVYAMRIPERFFPGKCDVWFHSHQLFHILVIAAAVVHYHGVTEMAMYRIANESVCEAVNNPHLHHHQDSSVSSILNGPVIPSYVSNTLRIFIDGSLKSVAS